MGMILFFLILLFLWQGTYWIGVDVLEIFNPRLCNRRSYWCGTGGVSLSFQIFAKKHEAHYSWYTDTAQCVLGTVFNPLVWPFDTSYPFCCCDGISVWYCNFS